MKKSIVFAVLLFLLPVQAYAAQSGPRDLVDVYLDAGKDPALTAQEREALRLVQKWIDGGQQNAPVSTGKDGSVQFIYGVAQPSILCAVLQVTDIELEPSEQVYSVHLGDTARWLVEPAITGSGALEVQHLVVKPKDIGLTTSLMVTTDRRTYHLKLRSHSKSYYPRVSFVYPDAMLKKFNNMQARDRRDRERDTIPETGEYLGDLHFDYDINGKASWKPLRVYNDGKKTIIQMPKEMTQTESPTLLVVRKEGGVFSDAETVMVNYRIQGDRYVVDTVFDRAILIAGVGNSQDKVTIIRRVK